MEKTAVECAGCDNFLNSGGEIAVDTIFLRHIANEILLDRSIERNVTRIWLELAKQQLKQSSFAAAIGANNAKKIFGCDSEIKVFEDAAAIVAEAKMLDGNEAHKSASLSCSRLRDMRS